MAIAMNVRIVSMLHKHVAMPIIIDVRIEFITNSAFLFNVQFGTCGASPASLIYPIDPA